MRNRIKGLDLIDRVPDELWTEVSDCTLNFQTFKLVLEKAQEPCHQGRDLFILLVVLRLHLRAPMPLESPEGSYVHGWEHWHSERSHRDDFWKKFRTLSFAKGQRAWEGTIFVFKDLTSWLEKRGTICTKSLKDISHAWPNLRGPGEWVILTTLGV